MDMRQLLAVSALMLAATVSQATPIQLQFTGVLESLTLSAEAGSVDGTGLVPNRAVNGSITIDDTAYSAGGWNTYIGSVDSLFTTVVDESMSIDVQWAGGTLQPSSYSGITCGPVLCEPYDPIQLRRYDKSG